MKKMTRGIGVLAPRGRRSTRPRPAGRNGRRARATRPPTRRSRTASSARVPPRPPRRGRRRPPARAARRRACRSTIRRRGGSAPPRRPASARRRRRRRRRVLGQDRLEGRADGTGGGSKLDGAGPIGSGLSGGSSEPIRPTATGAAAPLANSYICMSLPLRPPQERPGSCTPQWGDYGPADRRARRPSVGESANRPASRTTPPKPQAPQVPARPLRKAETAGGITASGRSRP